MLRAAVAAIATGRTIPATSPRHAVLPVGTVGRTRATPAQPAACAAFRLYGTSISRSAAAGAGRSGGPSPYVLLRLLGSLPRASSTRFQVATVPALYGLNVLASSTTVATSSSSTATSHSAIAVRSLSSSGEKKTGEGETSGGDPESTEIVLTPGQKVVAGTRLTMWAGIFCFATACAYYIGKELLPTKMSPNVVFDKATKVIRENGEIGRRFGEPIKVYGRDHGGHREGRRNFIEHTEYTNEDDGSKRTRVRFNLEGKFGKAFVFAEVSSDMPSGEFVYVLVQDKANGRVFTVVDNRSRLAAQRMAGGSKEGMEALSNLLGGGKK